MHKNNKFDEQEITNIIPRHIKPTKLQNQINLIIYYTKLKTSNFVVKNNTNSPKPFLNKTYIVYEFTCSFWDCLTENSIKPNTYVGHTTTTLSFHLTYHLFDIMSCC